MQKGKLFFNIIIAITIIALVSIIGYVAYYYIDKHIELKEAEKVIEEFKNEVIVVGIEEEPNNEVTETPQPSEQPTSQKNVNVSYKNYSVIGLIEIPKTKVEALIVDSVTPQSITAAVGVLYGAGLNQVGNTVLAAHNYRNGTFFSNNKKLVNGDKIYITDNRGQKIEYSIYNTYITGDMDFSYATRNTNGKREISLSTCTTDPTKRLVIWAKEN